MNKHHLCLTTSEKLDDVHRHSQPSRVAVSWHFPSGKKRKVQSSEVICSDAGRSSAASISSARFRRTLGCSTVNNTIAIAPIPNGRYVGLVPVSTGYSVNADSNAVHVHKMATLRR